MATTPDAGRRWAWIGAVVALLVVGAVVVVMLTGRETEPEAMPSPTPSPSPSPTETPTPELVTVQGERNVELVSESSARVLGLGEATRPDQDAIDQATNAIADWLDDHLDRLQREGRGSWGRMAADDLATSAERRPLTRDLANPDQPVAAATYHMRVHHDGAPRLVAVRVTVVDPEDEAREVELLFTVDGDGKPTLVLFGAPDEEEAP